MRIVPGLFDNLGFGQVLDPLDAFGGVGSILARAKLGRLGSFRGRRLSTITLLVFNGSSETILAAAN